MTTKVTSSLINTISASQIQASGATTGQVLTYNGSTSTWVASAAPSAAPSSTADFTGANQSLSASSGYQKLPGGLIIQWGTGTGGTAFNFPIAFPNACRVVVITPDPFNSIGIGSGVTFNNTSATPYTNAGNGNALGVSVHWVAYGY